MKQAWLASLFVFVLAGTTGAQSPSLTDVVRSPQDYAGKTLKFDGATLSGNIVKYDAAGKRMYYPTVQTQSGSLQAGFLLLPSDLGQQLSNRLDPKTNYTVNLTCKVEEVTINRVSSWQGIISKLEFIDANGKVLETFK